MEPVYRDGRTIRFSNRPAAAIPPDDVEPGSGTRVLYMQHPSDPITWWSPDLLCERPGLAEEPRGSDVLPETRWIPVVSFWQVSADLALGFSTPPGHGHNFTGEHVDGWAAVLQRERLDAGEGRGAPGRLPAGPVTAGSPGRVAQKSTASRMIGQVMQCPPPRPRPSSAPTIVMTSTPALRSSVLVWVLRS